MSSVSISIEQLVATITFSNPPHNALPGHMLSSIAETISSAGSDPQVHAIVLKSGGDRAFCGGASFDELTAISDFDEGKQFFMGFANVINACRQCPKLIIGRVQGKSVGGGVGLAAAVDYCIATVAADIKLSELALGIGPFVVGPAVQRKIGLSAFSQLSIDATGWQSASWARDKGLYAEVVDNIDILDTRIAQLSQTLAQSSPGAMAHLKEIFWQDCTRWDTLLAERAAISGTLVLSDFTKNAISKLRS